MSDELREQVDRILELQVDLLPLLHGAVWDLINKVRGWDPEEQIDFIRQAHGDDDLVTGLLRKYADEKLRAKMT
jgi:hypothetical protein